MNNRDEPKTMKELLYKNDDTDFCNYKLSDIPDPDEHDEVTVVARAHDRGSPFYNEGVYEVKRKYDHQSIYDKLDGQQMMSPDDLVDLMPRRPKQRKAVPSLRGEYLRVVEHKPNVSSSQRSTIIPIEYVIST